MANSSNQFNSLIHENLIESLRSNRCIDFVGAGLSAQVKRADGNLLPIWSGFLVELLDWAISKQVQFWGDPEDIRKMIVEGDLLMAAQELQERVSMVSYWRFYA